MWDAKLHVLHPVCENLRHSHTHTHPLHPLEKEAAIIMLNILPFASVQGGLQVWIHGQKCI